MKKVFFLLLCVLLNLILSAQEIQSSFSLKDQNKNEVKFHNDCNRFFRITIMPDSTNNKVIQHVFKGTFELQKGEDLLFKPWNETITYKSISGNKYKKETGFDIDGDYYKVSKNNIIQLKTYSATNERLSSISGFFHGMAFATSLVVAPLYAFFRKDDSKEVLKNFKNIFMAGVIMEGIGITIGLFRTSKTYHIKSADVPNNLKWSFE